MESISPIPSSGVRVHTEGASWKRTLSQVTGLWHEVSLNQTLVWVIRLGVVLLFFTPPLTPGEIMREIVENDRIVGASDERARA